MSAPVIELQDVTVPSRRDAEMGVLSGLNWTVAPGDFRVVGSVHGGGKSDFIFMLGGLTRPLRGTYLLFGQDMGRRFGDEFLPNRLRTGVVFDDARLFPPRTIAENVALPIRYHQNLTPDESASWVAALLNEMEIADIANEMPSAVSRLWRRRAALARALALRPELILIENTLRGLDARHAAWWVDFLVKLHRGHSLMAGKPVTIVATSDELWPWRNSGADFSTIDERGLTDIGKTAPSDYSPFSQGALAGAPSPKLTEEEN
jgi:ABC-type transporter Mla maintaining outer membrane lipid asymmetry ATPase subunit MlaF